MLLAKRGTGCSVPCVVIVAPCIIRSIHCHPLHSVGTLAVESIGGAGIHLLKS